MDDDATLEAAARSFLRHAVTQEHDWDEDPNLIDTPKRFAKMIRELTTAEDFNFTTFPNTAGSEMIVQKDIHFVALCSHHIVPFMGVAHVAYIPDKVIVGLSKLARTVRWWAAGLWTQEELTQAIVNNLDDALEPLGVAVIMEAEHLCMSIRGIQAPGTRTLTSTLRGVFLDPPEGRDPKGEFIRLAGYH